MLGRNRCGAMCICIQKGNDIGLEVVSLITEVQIEGHQRTFTMPSDLSVGEFIPMDRLVKEHRSLVIIDSQGEYVDEGEVEYKSPSFIFVSDYDFGDDPKPQRPIESLIGFKIEIKCELFDQVGAARSLRAFRKIWRE